MTTKPQTIQFAPGVLEDIMNSMSEDEAQNFVDAIYESIKSGEFMSQSTPVDMDLLEMNDPDLYHNIVDQLHAISSNPITCQ